MRKGGHKFRAISSTYDARPTLHDCLSCYSVSELRGIAKRYRYKNCGKLRKTELIECLEQSILDYRELYELILSVNACEFKSAEKTAKELNFVKSKNWLPHFVCFGCAFVLEINGEPMNYMPSEVAELFESINTHAFTKQRKYHQSLWNYYCACVNLYGVISADEIVGIFNAQNRCKTNRDELLTVLYLFANKGKPMYFFEDYCVHRRLAENQELRSLIERHKEPPIEVPGRKELLTYVDEDFYELIPELQSWFF